MSITAMASGCMTSPHSTCYMTGPGSPRREHNYSAGIDAGIKNYTLINEVKLNYQLQPGRILNKLCVYVGPEGSFVFQNGNYSSTLAGPQLGIRYYGIRRHTLFSEFTYSKNFWINNQSQANDNFGIKLGLSRRVIWNRFFDAFIGYTFIKNESPVAGNITVGLRYRLTYRL
ncbi:MAG: hypothetical protein V2A54_05680 [Bacteroidota bacterium]